MGRVSVVSLLAATAIIVWARSVGNQPLVTVEPVEVDTIRQTLGPKLTIADEQPQAGENGWAVLASGPSFTLRGSRATFLADSAPIAQIIDQAIAKPTWHRSVDQPGKDPRAARSLAKTYTRVLQARLETVVRQGDMQAVYDEASRIAGLTDQMLASARTLPEWMDGVIATRQYANTLAEMAATQQLSAEDSQKLLRLVEARVSLRQTLADTVRRELDDRFVTRGLAQGFPAKMPINAALDGEAIDPTDHPEEEFWRPLLAGHPEPLNVAETLDLARSTYTRLVDALTKDYFAIEKALAEIPELIGPFPAEVFSVDGQTTDKQKSAIREKLSKIKNPYGKYLVLSFLPNYGKISDPGFRAEATLTGAKTLLAVRLYQARFNQIPKGLDDLQSSGILKAIPIDPYTRKPLAFNRTTRVIRIEHPTISRPQMWTLN
ncbi:MAG: hypothetical protein MUC92_00100 [Fimbriimonadaceae bacterium]|nr:hypothetical protein [Fimbriimonadaceae bacterium]